MLTLKFTGNLIFSVRTGQHSMYSSVDYGNRNGALDLPSFITPVAAFDLV